MLELFVVRGQLAITIFAHASLSAVAWTATILAATSARRPSTHGDATDTSEAWWTRARLCSPWASLTAVLVLAQLVLFWHPLLSIAGPLLLPLAIYLLSDFGRTLLLQRSVTMPDRSRCITTAVVGWIAGASAILGLAWLGHPVGADLTSERVVDGPMIAAFTNTSGWIRVCYVSLGALALGTTLFAVGAARRGRSKVVATTTRALVLVLTLQGLVGAATVRSIGQTEPVKLAAMTALWETQPEAPLELGAWPLDFAETNIEGLRLGGLLSIWIHGDSGAEVEGALNTRMENRPPVLALYGFFQAIVLSSLLAWVSALVAWRRSAGGATPRWWLALTTVPTVVLAWGLGWLLAELGRSPWTIRHLLRVGDATWTPYGMAPTGVLWVLTCIVAVFVAGRRLRRLDPPPTAPALGAPSVENP